MAVTNGRVMFENLPVGSLVSSKQIPAARGGEPNAECWLWPRMLDKSACKCKEKIDRWSLVGPVSVPPIAQG